jgi:transcriptional pleiotropic regulator of transition state genes
LRSTGILRKIDNLGRLVISKELRSTMDINKKDQMEVYVDGDKIILKKYESASVFCVSADDTVEYEGTMVCKECIDEMDQ